MNVRIHSLLGKLRQDNPNPGFTIVELLVVIVVIGILATLTVVAYTGISQRAVAASLQSDLSNAAQQLKLYYIDHGSYPTGLNGNKCPLGSSAPSPDTRYCLKFSPGNTYDYDPSTPSTYTLTATNTNGAAYRATENTGPVVYVAPAIVVTGGDVVTIDGLYTVRKFTSSGTLTVANGTISGAQVLVVAGGGSGGHDVVNGTGASGGGAGGLVYQAARSIAAGTIAVIVGGGGAAITTDGSRIRGNSGSDSVFDTITAKGGGAGGTYNSGSTAGGSGGGGFYYDSGQNYAGGATTQGDSGGGTGYGYAGGANSLSYHGDGAGGGGAGGVGATCSSVASTGGVGRQYSQFAGVAGSPAGWFAGGGGGAKLVENTGNIDGGAGGSGGGGMGKSGTAAVAGASNTGGGGGAAGATTVAIGNSGAGGSGIVIIRYLTPN